MKSVKRIQNFHACELKLTEASTASHTIYFKEHIVREHTKDKPQGRTLLVVNVPPYVDESGMIHAFSDAGTVRSVQFYIKPSTAEVKDVLKFIPDPQETTFKAAYLVFKTVAELDKALKLSKLRPLNSDKHQVKVGMKKWIEEYNSSIILPKKLKENVESFMKQFDLESQKQEKKEKELEGEDDEGWVTVTKKGKVQSFARSEKVENKIMQKEERKKKRKELKNFYTFQIRESKMKHIVALRHKFEEDKKKIAQIKQSQSTAAVCEFFSQPGGCGNGPQCPYRHVRGDRTVVCKHWLRGLCKKGDQCEFLHEYDMSKMPECYFYARFNACHNKECPFLHIDPESKIKDCPWYDRGFCRHGPHCRHRHVRRVFCMNYLTGFCPDGPSCKYMHPRFELPAPPEQTKDAKRLPVCHYCSEVGHKASTCNKIPAEQREVAQRQEEARYRALGYVKPANENEEAHGQRLQRMVHKPLEEVTCFKCGTKGHYANKCPKGHLAFLSSQSGQNNNPNSQNNNPNNMFKKPN